MKKIAINLTITVTSVAGLIMTSHLNTIERANILLHSQALVLAAFALYGGVMTLVRVFE